MITNQKNKRPIISFGLGRTEKTISLGETVKVWQNEIYREDNYFLRFFPIDAPVYGFEYTPTSTGTELIQARIISNDGKINILSNIIKLTVI